jgi:hypothetical protein
LSQAFFLVLLLNQQWSPLLLLLLLCGCWCWQQRRMAGGGSILTWSRILAKLIVSQQVSTSHRLRKLIWLSSSQWPLPPLTHILSQVNGTITGSSSPFVCPVSANMITGAVVTTLNLTYCRQQITQL